MSQRQVDTSTPSIARSYDATLGGKDNFAIDRELRDHVFEHVPSARDMAMANRRWLVRVVRWLAGEAGIDQFLDVGSGLPTLENTHDVAQRVNPTATVVYVDNDPACLAYGRALLEENSRTRFVDADLAAPESLLGHERVAGLLDWDRPVGLIHCSTMHHVPDAGDPYGVMQRYIAALPAGSYLALTHFWDPQDPEGYYTGLARDLEQRFEVLGSGFWRTREQIASYFDGLDLLEPGLVELDDWWPGGPRLREQGPGERLCLGGVARKP